MPGPSWYAQSLFDQTLHIPAGQITAAAAAAVGERDADHDRPGRRRPVDHLEALQQPQGRRGLRHLGHDGLQPDRQGRPARLPGLRAAGRPLAGDSGHQPVLRRRSDAGAQGGGRPDLDGLEPGHLPGPARLVQHRGHQAGRRQVAELPDATVRRRPRSGGAGLRVHGRPAVTMREGVRSQARGAGAGHAYAWPARRARPLFVLPYLPFLLVFGILPMIYALYLAVTNDTGGWAGIEQLHQDDPRLPLRPRVRAHPALHERVARLPHRARRRAGAAAARPRQPGLVGLPLPLLHSGRAGRRIVRPGLAVHARPVRQPRFVSAAPRARLAPVRRVDRAREPALRLRDDRVLDRGRRLDRRHVRRAEHHPARAGGGGADRRGRAP